MPRKSTKRCSLRRLFDTMDADHSGNVTMAEVTKAFKKAAGDDNKLTFKEMVTACRKTPRKSTKKGTRRGGVGENMMSVTRLFRQLDEDNSGEISEEEFFDEDKDNNGLSEAEWMNNFKDLTENDKTVAKTLFAKLSKGDGNISHADFKAAAGPATLSAQKLLKVYNSNAAVRGSARRRL